MDTYVIKLRNLTYKSQLLFGKFKDCTVQDLLNMQLTGYLRWVYYNCDKITYIPEILEKIYVQEEDMITKPGKDPQKGKELSEKIRHRTGVERIVQRGRFRNIQKAKNKGFYVRDGIKYSRQAMQRKNHGY